MKVLFCFVFAFTALCFVLYKYYQSDTAMWVCFVLPWVVLIVLNPKIIRSPKNEEEE